MPGTPVSRRSAPPLPSPPAAPLRWQHVAVAAGTPPANRLLHSLVWTGRSAISFGGSMGSGVLAGLAILE